MERAASIGVGARLLGFKLLLCLLQGSCLRLIIDPSVPQFPLQQDGLLFTSVSGVPRPPNQHLVGAGLPATVVQGPITCEPGIA